MNVCFELHGDYCRKVMPVIQLNGITSVRAVVPGISVSLQIE